MHYYSAITVAKTNDLPDLYTVVYKNMSESYYDLQDYKMAYDYYQKYTHQIKQLNTGVTALNLESVKEYLNLKSSDRKSTRLNSSHQ